MFTRHSASRSPQRLILVIGIATLFLSLAAPVLAVQAAAMQEDTPRCEDGFVFNEETGGCDPRLEPANRQPITSDLPSVLQPTEPPPDCEDGFIFSPDAGGCVPDPDAAPTETPVEPTQVPLDCEDGFVFDVETGGCDPLPVTEESVEPTRVVIEPTQEPESTVVEETREPEEPTQPEEGSATVNITAWVCPDDSKLDPKAESAEELARLCVKPLPGVGLELLSNGGPFIRDETNDQGRLLIGDVPPGELTVTQRPPQGYSFGAVVTTLYPDGPDGDPLPPTISNEPAGGSRSTLDPDVLIGIDFYYFFDISITIETYWCRLPPSNGQYQPVEALAGPCQLTGPGATLLLIGLNSNISEWVTKIVPGTPSATATWTNLSIFGGPYQITGGNVDDTVWTPEVRCREQGGLTSLSNQFVTQQPVPSPGGYTIELPAHLGLNWECKWYHFTDNTIYIEHFLCANTPPPGTTPTTLDTACDSSAGVNNGFTLTNANGSMYELTFASGKSEGGIVLFEPLPEGEAALTRDPIAGYGDSIVYCREHGWMGGNSFDYGGIFGITPDNFGAVHVGIDQTSSYIQSAVWCWWYSIPGPSQIPSETTVEPEPTVPQAFVTVAPASGTPPPLAESAEPRIVPAFDLDVGAADGTLPELGEAIDPGGILLEKPSSIIVVPMDCANHFSPSTVDVETVWAACGGTNPTDAGFTLTYGATPKHATTSFWKGTSAETAFFNGVPTEAFTLARDPDPAFDHSWVMCGWEIPPENDGGPTIYIYWTHAPLNANGEFGDTITNPGTRITCIWFYYPDNVTIGRANPSGGAVATIELPETKPPLLIPICDPEIDFIDQTTECELEAPASGALGDEQRAAIVASRLTGEHHVSR